MSHPDEGQLTALLDNELTAAERSAVESHLMGCEECRRLFEEVKAIATDADGLVTAIELPPSRPLAPVGASSNEEPPPRSARGKLPRRAAWVSRWRNLAWAASLLLAVGLGWVASDMRLANRQEALGEGGPDSGPPLAANELIKEEVQPAAPPRAQAEEKAALGETRSLRRADEDVTDRAVPAPTEPPQPSPAPAAAPPFGNAAAAAGEMDGRANLGLLARKSVAPPAAPAVAESAPADEVTQRRETGFRQVEMEEAVRVLSGSIRLVDGLQPERVLLGPGKLVRGADPAFPVIRVVYEDPPGREMWLDLQRPAEAEGARFRDSRSGMLVGDTVITRGSTGSTSVRWIDEHGFRLALTGFLATDSLNALMRRIR